MLLNIKGVLNVPGTRLDLDFEVSKERLDEVKHVVFASPVKVTGSIENHAGVVIMDMQIAFSLLVTCDRCLKETVQDFSYHEEHTVVRRLESEDEEENYVIAQAESIDAEEIALTDLLLELPTKMLCREDCKGLCPVCGCDRNEVDCGHEA
jgi:uncharacterized protein